MIISELGNESGKPLIDRAHPAEVKIKERFLITSKDSSKQVSHVVLDIKNKDLGFKVGDSLGIYAQNGPILVRHLILAMKAKEDARVTESRSGKEMTLWKFLSYKANLSRVTSSFLKLFYEYETVHDKKNELHRLLQQENKPLLSQYLSAYDPLDLFREYKEIETPLQELCNQFGPLLPRFYSIASSPKAVDSEVDLTVALSTFTHSGEQRFGVASHFLCRLAECNDTLVPIYVQPTQHFTLPSDGNIPIIMVGPGTGIAPFRAFLQEREFLGATGKNWLFFGERNRHSDYFYQDYFEKCVREKKLTLDLAFSRDQPEKIYVQHRMLEKARELWAWLQEGAYFYVCGDAHHMAKDVEAALNSIARSQGHLSEDEAKAYVKSLRKQGRYLADVY